MADNNKLELVVEVDVNRANASIKSINSDLSSLEQAAAKAARGTSSGIDGITVSMVKGATAGNLFADAIKKGFEWMKQWTVEAALGAAHTTKMAMSMGALAAAHGVSSQSAAQAVESIKRVGYGAQDAIHAVNRLMIANLGLEKAQGLAKVAKDAAAIENISPAEGLEKLLLAIESGASRGLRTMGLFVDLNKDIERQQKLTGRAVSESETLQIRYNAVMRAAIGIQGAAAAASGSAETQYKAMQREINALREAVGSKFQGELTAVAGVMKNGAHWAREHADAIAKVSEAVISLAAVLAATSLVGKLGALAGAGKWLVGALNPLTIVLGAVALSLRGMIDMWHGLKKEWENDPFLNLALRGRSPDMQAAADSMSRKGLPKPSADALTAPKREELSDDDLDRIVEARKMQGEALRQFQDAYLRAIEERKAAESEAARARIDDSMKMIEATSNETTVARESLNVLLQSRREYEAGIAKIRDEERREIEKASTKVMPNGQILKITLDAQALSRIHQTTAERIAAFDLKFAQEESGRIEQIWKAMAARQQRFIEQHITEPMRQTLYLWQQAQEWQDRIDDQDRGAKRQAIDQRRDFELAQLEAVDAQTIQAKIALENAKTEIEGQAIRERARIEAEQIAVNTERQVSEARRAAMAQGILDEARLSEIEAKVRQLGQHEAEAVQQAATSEVDLAQIKGAAATRKIVTDEYRSIFQTLKEQAGGVFDALVTKSQSVWAAIGNSLKTALLTAIKDVVKSRVAAMLMNLFMPGAQVQMSGTRSGTGRGILGGLGGLFGIGAVPVFGGTGGGTFGSGPVGGNPLILSAVGHAAGGAGSVAPQASGGIGGLTGWGAMAASYKGWLSQLGNIGYGPKGGDFGGEVAGSYRGVGGATGGAMLLGGSLLAMDGLRRGGWTGLGETTAGGGLIGYKFGGPLGAAIGAAAGLAAGLVRMFVKGAEEKAREKIKATYGVDISDKNVLTQIAQTAKSAFGGNLDMAIRSPQVRELIELYAMTTGQRTKGMPGTAQSLTMVETGGSLYQSPYYSNGTALPALGGLPSLDAVKGGVASNAGPLVIQLDGPATTALLRGEAVQAIVNNPRAVQSATMNATRSNAGRREMASLQLSPGLLTA